MAYTNIMAQSAHCTANGMVATWWVLVSTVPFCVLKDQIIYLNNNIGLYFTSLSCGYESAYNTSTPSCANDSAYNASNVSFNSTAPIDLSWKFMRDGLSVLLTQWTELDRKFSEFHEMITFEGNNMNVAMYKKLISDLQLEWEELNEKSNIILEYEWRHKGVLKRSCPPVRFSDCNCTNSTPWISQSKNGMASEDPLCQSTVSNGIHGDYYSCVTFDNLTEDNEVYVV